MNVVHKIEHWGDTHHPKFLDLVRVVLGVFLLLKGVAFMENTAYLRDLIDSQDVINLSPGVLMVLIYYVVFAHMIGGILITLGIFTRLASIVQIPVVLGAVFLTGIFKEPINALEWPSVTALIFLSMFTILGSGPISLDRYLEG
jgi:putative oxidoreductase